MKLANYFVIVLLSCLATRPAYSDGSPTLEEVLVSRLCGLVGVNDGAPKLNGTCTCFQLGPSYIISAGHCVAPKNYFNSFKHLNGLSDVGGGVMVVPVLQQEGVAVFKLPNQNPVLGQVSIDMLVPGVSKDMAASILRNNEKGTGNEHNIFLSLFPHCPPNRNVTSRYDGRAFLGCAGLDHGDSGAVLFDANYDNSRILLNIFGLVQGGNQNNVPVGGFWGPSLYQVLRSYINI